MAKPGPGQASRQRKKSAQRQVLSRATREEISRLEGRDRELAALREDILAQPRQAIGSFSSTINPGQPVIGVNTFQKMNTTVELWDINGWYDATIARYFPLIAGIYRLTVHVHKTSTAAGSYIDAGIAKGIGVGAAALTPLWNTSRFAGAAGQDIVVTGSWDVKVAVGEYYEMWWRTEAGTATALASFFQGYAIGGL